MSPVTFERGDASRLESRTAIPAVRSAKGSAIPAAPDVENQEPSSKSVEYKVTWARCPPVAAVTYILDSSSLLYGVFNYGRAACLRQLGRPAVLGHQGPAHNHLKGGHGLALDLHWIPTWPTSKSAGRACTSAEATGRHGFKVAVRCLEPRTISDHTAWPN